MQHHAYGEDKAKAGDQQDRLTRLALSLSEPEALALGRHFPQCPYYSLDSVHTMPVDQGRFVLNDGDLWKGRQKTMKSTIHMRKTSNDSDLDTSYFNAIACTFRSGRLHFQKSIDEKRSHLQLRSRA
eukprot:2291885-Amphidinium_carterae.1